MINILICADRAIARDALVEALNGLEDMNVVANVDLSGDILSIMAQSRPDVVIVELREDGLGLECARRVRARGRNAKVILIAPTNFPAVALDAARSGIQGFLSDTHNSLGDLISAVRSVKEGRVAISQSLVLQALTVGPSPLSEREREVLKKTSDGDLPSGISAALNLAVGTVRNHLTTAKIKLGAGSVFEAVSIARRNGWLISSGRAA
ncbi:LuxR C-terminal-related transcriptional regulator [Amycolatopsis sp. cmx-11-12]|uniref:LuxR C-terminal-related transcriptional regulator n=1 Tax=Amycolatopsis sp. cmx-11-12 TaxID=2785795 RepID=UPI003917E26B